MSIWIIRVSLFLIFAGTTLLAFSIKPEEDPMAPDKPVFDMWEPNKTRIIPLKFWGGLALIGLGTALQFVLTFLH